jgi:hypothetical protein
MARLVLHQLARVLESYEQRDATEALAVWRNDLEIDSLNNSLFRECLTYMLENPRNITFCTHLLFCAKNLERMGDHTTNIAETVYISSKGAPCRTSARRWTSPASKRRHCRLEVHARAAAAGRAAPPARRGSARPAARTAPRQRQDRPSPPVTHR